jgi:RNA polymerase sigma factor (sigma-70 family)
MVDSANQRVWSQFFVLREERVVRDFRNAEDDELLLATPRHPRAFDEFYVRHEAGVLAYFRRRTESPEVALDLAAETFTQALLSVTRYKSGREPAVAWLLGIARHTLLNSLRKGRVAAKARSRLGMPVLTVDDDELARIDSLGSFSAVDLLAALPADQAEAIRARVVDDLSYEEVAAQLQCSSLVARKRVSRGLATLRSLVVEETE